MTLNQAQERIKELEALVAMASPPSAYEYPTGICVAWCGEQRKIKRKLDGIAKRMKRRNNNG